MIVKHLSVKRLAVLAALAPACVHTSLHSPRALTENESTAGVHLATFSPDNNDDDESDVVGGLIIGTIRKGTSVGEFGGNFGLLGMEGSYKYPLTDNRGTTHVSLIGSVGLWGYIVPEASVGLLAGQDLGPLTLYGGFRQYVVAGLEINGEGEGTIPASNAIAGIEIRMGNVALQSEMNYNFVGNGADSDSDLQFNVPIFTVGLVFGKTRQPRPVEPRYAPPLQYAPPQGAPQPYPQPYPQQPLAPQVAPPAPEPTQEVPPPDPVQVPAPPPIAPDDAPPTP